MKVFPSPHPLKSQSEFRKLGQSALLPSLQKIVLDSEESELVSKNHDSTRIQLDSTMLELASTLHPNQTPNLSSETVSQSALLLERVTTNSKNLSNLDSPLETKRMNSYTSIAHVDLPVQNKLMQHNDTFPWYLVHPDSITRSLWDIIMLTALLYTLAYLPLRIAFVDSSWDWSDLALDFLFCIDLLISCLSAYRDQKTGEVIDDLWLITINYLFGWFLIDLFTCLPFYLFVSDDSLARISFVAKAPRLLKVVRILRAVKFFRSTRFQEYFEKWEDSSSFHPAFWRILRMVIGIFAMAHVFACLWIYVGKSYADTDDTWLTYAKLNNSSDESIYLASFYWFIVTFCTVGYGDIAPRNDAERFFVVIVICCSFAVYSYLTASLASIVKSLDKHLEIYRERTSTMQKFFELYNIPHELQVKVKYRIFK